MLVLLAAAGCQPVYERERGTALWNEHCARCHGPDGRGEPRMAALSNRLDLRSSPLVARGPAGGPAINRLIREGVEGMPGFEHRLEPGEINQLTAFVVELATNSPTDERK